MLDEIRVLCYSEWAMNWVSEKTCRRNYLQKCLNFTQAVNIVYNELIDESDSQKSAISFILCDYEELLDRYRLLTFGRMIDLAIQNLKKKVIMCYIQYLMVDEYQDINRAKRSLWAPGARSKCVSVGDPRQAYINGGGQTSGSLKNSKNASPGCRPFI